MAAHENEDALTLAIRHVAQARRIVWQQRARIERLGAGCRYNLCRRDVADLRKQFENLRGPPGLLGERTKALHCGRHVTC
jgi:hypothetical protein